MNATHETPPPFALEGKGDRIEAFQLWKQRMDIFSQTTEKTQDKLVPYILKSLDDAGLKAYNAFQLSEEDKKNPAKIFEKFEELLNISKPNFRAARLDYFYMRQQKEETLDAFYIRCREKAKTCDFEPEEEKEFFLILLVASTPLKDIQKWLISQKKTVTLEKVLAEGRSYEAQAINVKHIHEREKTSVEVASVSTKRGKKSSCISCGRDHGRGRDNCPAKTSKCNFCSTVGHWEKQCLKKQKSNNSCEIRPRRPPTPHRGSHKSRQRKVDVVAYDTKEEMTEYEYDSIGVGVIVAIESIRNEAYTKIASRLNSEDRCRRTVKVKVDTGAQGNTLPLRIYHQLFPDDIGTDGLPSKKTQAKAMNVRLKAYYGTLIPCFGQVRLQCRDHNSRWSSQTFFVVDVEGPAVAGLPMAEKLGLVILSCNITTDTVVQKFESIDQLKREFPDQFDKIGRLPGKARLYLKEDATPYTDPPRKFAIHVKEQLKEELDKMTTQGVIRKVTEHPDWCSSIPTAIKANGSLRVCLDPSRLNKSLKRYPHKILTTEEITHRFHGAQYFSKLDAVHGYWSVEIHEKDQLLTTFRTPFASNAYPLACVYRRTSSNRGSMQS
jgi:hypothetical protein